MWSLQTIAPEALQLPCSCPAPSVEFDAGDKSAFSFRDDCGFSGKWFRRSSSVTSSPKRDETVLHGIAIAKAGERYVRSPSTCVRQRPYYRLAGTICTVKVLLGILRRENPMAGKKPAAKKKAAKKFKGVRRENAKGRQ
jgi:hypothetical protein